jgi:hypothetical protein
MGLPNTARKLVNESFLSAKVMSPTCCEDEIWNKKARKLVNESFLSAKVMSPTCCEDEIWNKKAQII